MKAFNCYAAEMIPIRMTIAIIVIAAVATMFAIGYHNFSISNAEHEIASEWMVVESKLYSMLGSGVARDLNIPGDAEGTKRVHTFYFPSNMMFFSFGVDPDPDANGVLESDLTADGALVCYQLYGSSKHIIWLEKEFLFREGMFSGDQWIINEEGFIIDCSGLSTITFELVKDGGTEFILIQATDAYS